ncbi:MarR family winged helix-turn-helix transcriptional regulator [Actinomadura alba]|nr:MarR family winged helix-turn-helix transcriptional regulator [Actinomadura alba]
MRRPIGYWCKRLDRLIEEAFDRAFGAAGVSRRQWQTLNVLGHGPAGDDALAEALRPFWDGGDVPMTGVIADLRGRGWIERDPAGRHGLTPGGRAAHARIAEAVAGIRATVAQGVTDEEYRVTMDVLRRMTENLEHVC